MKPHRTVVFPAITTQMHRDGSLNLDATSRLAEVLIASGMSGIVFLGMADGAARKWFPPLACSIPNHHARTT